MANLTFPSNPTNGQKFTSNGKVFAYDSTTQRWSVTRAQLLGSLPDDVTIDAPTLSVSLSTIALDTVGANVYVTYTIDQDVDARLSVTGIEDTTATLYKSNNTIVVTAGATDFSGGQISLVVTNGRTSDTETIDVSLAISWIMDIVTFTHNPTTSTRTQKISAQLTSMQAYCLTGNDTNQAFWVFQVNGSKANIFSSTSKPPNAMNFSSMSIGTRNFSPALAAPIGVEWKNDGTVLYINDTSSYIYQYPLTTAYDLNTLNPSTYDRFQVEYQSRDLHFSPDGTKVYYCPNQDNGGVSQRTLSTPWDITSAGSVTSLSGGDLRLTGVSLNPSGEYLYTIGWSNFGNNGANLRRYVLTTPFDISTATQDQVFNKAAVDFGNYSPFCLSMHNKLMPISVTPIGSNAKLFRWGL